MKPTEEQIRHRQDARWHGEDALWWVDVSKSYPHPPLTQIRSDAARFKATLAAHYCFLAHPELRGDDK